MELTVKVDDGGVPHDVLWEPYVMSPVLFPECRCCPDSVDSVHKAPAQLRAAALESPRRINWGIIRHMEK